MNLGINKNEDSTQFSRSLKKPEKNIKQDVFYRSIGNQLMRSGSLHHNHKNINQRSNFKIPINIPNKSYKSHYSKNNNLESMTTNQRSMITTHDIQSSQNMTGLNKAKYSNNNIQQRFVSHDNAKPNIQQNFIISNLICLPQNQSGNNNNQNQNQNQKNNNFIRSNELLNNYSVMEEKNKNTSINRISDNKLSNHFPKKLLGKRESMNENYTNNRINERNTSPSLMTQNETDIFFHRKPQSFEMPLIQIEKTLSQNISMIATEGCKNIITPRLSEIKQKKPKNVHIEMKQKRNKKVFENQSKGRNLETENTNIKEFNVNTKYITKIDHLKNYSLLSDLANLNTYSSAKGTYKSRGFSNLSYVDNKSAIDHTQIKNHSLKDSIREIPPDTEKNHDLQRKISHLYKTYNNTISNPTQHKGFLGDQSKDFTLDLSTHNSLIEPKCKLEDRKPNPK